jgi:hypothetical protein
MCGALLGLKLSTANLKRACVAGLSPTNTSANDNYSDNYRKSEHVLYSHINLLVC